MKKQLFSFLLLLFFFSSVPAQEKEAVMVDEFGREPCGIFNARMDSLYTFHERNPELKIYVVYYGAKSTKVDRYNEKTKTWERNILRLPHSDDALNLAKAVPLYLESLYNFPKNTIFLSDGGFKENFTFEIWLVPENAEAPKPLPTIDKKDVKFRKSSPIRTPNCATAYDMYK